MSLAGCGKGQSCESWCQNFSNNIFKLLTSPCSFLHGNKISSILIGCFLQQCTLGIVFDFSRNVTTNRTIIEGTLHTIFSPKPLLYSINWWILTINNIYTLSDFFNFIQHYQLCSLGDANDANSCTKCLSGTNWLRLAWNLERELWNWSGVSDEGRLTASLWYCVLYFLSPGRPTLSVSTPFQNENLCLCCCMIVSEGNIFCFCPLWANERKEESHLRVQFTAAVWWKPPNLRNWKGIKTIYTDMHLNII